MLLEEAETVIILCNHELLFISIKYIKKRYRHRNNINQKCKSETIAENN